MLTPTPAQDAARESRAVRAAGVILATALALALQTTLARFLVRGTVGGRPRAGRGRLRGADVRAGHRPADRDLRRAGPGRAVDGVIGIGGLAKTMVGFRRRRHRHAVHRRAAAAAVRGVFRRDRAARGDVHRAVRAARPAAISGRRTPPSPARRSATRSSASSPSSWPSSCPERSSGGGPARRGRLRR